MNVAPSHNPERGPVAHSSRSHVGSQSFAKGIRSALRSTSPEELDRSLPPPTWTTHRISTQFVSDKQQMTSQPRSPICVTRKPRPEHKREFTLSFSRALQAQASPWTRLKVGAYFPFLSLPLPAGLVKVWHQPLALAVLCLGCVSSTG